MIHEDFWSPIHWMNQFSQWLRSLVLYSFFGVQTSVFNQNYVDLDHCFSVSSFVLSRWGVCCNWTLSTSVTGETSGLSAPNAFRSRLPRKKFGNRTVGNAISCIPWIERNLFPAYVYFVELFSESRYSWFLSLSTKIHDFLQVLTIHDSASTPDVRAIWGNPFRKLRRIRGCASTFLNYSRVPSLPCMEFEIRNFSIFTWPISVFDKCIHARMLVE